MQAVFHQVSAGDAYEHFTRACRVEFLRLVDAAYKFSKFLRCIERYVRPLESEKRYTYGCLYFKVHLVVI